MARYSLIIRDATYMSLLKKAASQGKTMGKLLNEILDREAKTINADGHVAASPVCIICGQKATIQGSGRGQQQLFVCNMHKTLIRSLDSYREL